jgi:hypothetical protein
MFEVWYSVFPVIINGAVIYLLNRFYFRSYKTFPFAIDLDNEKMICYDFMRRKKKVELKLIDIDSISGGIFSKRSTKPIIMESSKNNISIGIHPHIRNFNKLLTIILSNIDQDLYDKLLQRIQTDRNVSLDRMSRTKKGKDKKRKAQR